MIYIDALGLINLAVKNNLIEEKDGKILVYIQDEAKDTEGWYLEDKDFVAKDLMATEEGQNTIIEALKEKGIEFVQTDRSLLGVFNNAMKKVKSQE